MCIVPQKYRLLNKIVDENNDGEVDENEINNAINILEKAKRDQEQKKQKSALVEFDMEKI
jgi:hypothetical protein